MTQCPLCGFEFDGAQMACHASCVFNERCAIICCPNCGYQIPDARRSVLAEGLRRWLNRRSGPVPSVEAVCRLTELHPGQCGQVIKIDSASHERIERLQVLGLSPAAMVTLEQKRPAYVIRVGFTELSLEHDIAHEIMVRVQPADAALAG
ncbi:MAG TPA: FeoA family protein [Candidatus Limnocylindrales bacterium]|nr:FeoA family protein [Candidatus Limnocylindrales bacterium]